MPLPLRAGARRRCLTHLNRLVDAVRCGGQVTGAWVAKDVNHISDVDVMRLSHLLGRVFSFWGRGLQHKVAAVDRVMA
ncbi:chemotaxis protein, partial [Xanthomonas perforans]|nr:chemotaxis protein [Xanthomonas perforans]